MVEALLYGFLGAVLGVIVSFLTLRYNYKDLYARTVSSNRMEWTNKFREEVAEVVAALKCSKYIAHYKNNHESCVINAEKARARLLMRLNMNTSKYGNEFNEVMSDILTGIDFSKPYPKPERLIDDLIHLSREILKIEWERVKKEAGGKEQ